MMQHNEVVCSVVCVVTVLGEVVAPCYQDHHHCGSVDKEVPQLHATLSEPLD